MRRRPVRCGSRARTRQGTPRYGSIITGRQHAESGAGARRPESPPRMKTNTMRRAAIGGVTVLQLLATVIDARAQDPTGHVAVEAVASASVSSADDGDPFLIFDQTSTIGVGRGWDVVVRPWARRMPGGDWAAEMYQFQVRYTSMTRIPVRLDAGVICSPIGLSTLELRLVVFIIRRAP